MKNRIFLKILLLVVLISSVAEASDLPSLAKYLLPYRKVFQNNFYTYHYVTRDGVKVSRTGILDQQLPQIANHVSDWSQYFWNLSQPSGTGMIRGFYLASDPVVSREFGKDNWLLYRVKLHQGLSYLDMQQIDGQPADLISESALSILRANGCDETKWHYLIYKSFVPQCREIALKTLKDLNVDVIQYPWVSTNFDSCANRSDNAYILINPKSIPTHDIQMFYSEQPMLKSSSLANEAKYIEAFFNHVLFDSSRGGTAPQASPKDFKPWPELDDKISSDDFKNYLKKNILDCHSE
jgi:hypothetical protein